jgi:hypothetical protein
MAEQPSALWQNGVLYVAALFLLWEIYGGWRRGLIRSALHFGAFIGSGFVGLACGKAIATGVGIFMPGLALVSGLLAGITTALATLGICLFFSAFLFKRTSQQPPGMLHWLFGLGGAFFVLLTGIFLLLGAITLVRTSGAIANADPKSPVLTSLAKIKSALEKGPIGGLVQSTDILSTDNYDTIDRLGALSKNPDAIMRFLDYPGVQEIVAHPRVRVLLKDRALIQAADQKDYVTILQNRALREAASDPELQRLVIDLDLQKALDYAMPEGQDSNTQKKKNQ